MCSSGNAPGLALRMTANSAVSNQTLSPYIIICDAGSTGTRLYVYKKKVAPDVGNIGLRGGPISSTVTTLAPNDEPPESSLDIHIQVGKKVKPGLSEQEPSSVIDYILPSLLDAVGMIPPKYHAMTPLFVYATGGMRLLPEQHQIKLYDGLVTGLLSNKKVPFLIKRGNFRTIEGADEGYFAVLAVNYLAGRLGSDLRVLLQESSTQTNHTGGKSIAEYVDTRLSILGALDLGGASAQIVFYAPDQKSESFDRHGLLHRNVRREDFFSKSLLGFGSIPMRDKLESYVVARAQQEKNSTIMTMMDGGEEIIAVSNPCYFQGYSKNRSNIALIGSGDGKKCMQNFNDIISKQITDAGNHTHDLLGARYPSVRGDFYAMTLYYSNICFVRDVLDELIQSNETLSPKKEEYIRMQELLTVSNPSLESLLAATHVVCNWRYEFLEEHSSAYSGLTSPEKMPYRCLEFSYIVVLLQHFDFFHDDNCVHFVNDIRNQTLEWSLGAFLDIMNSNEKTAKITNRLQNSQESPSITKMPMLYLMLFVTGYVICIFRNLKLKKVHTESPEKGGVKLS